MEMLHSTFEDAGVVLQVNVPPVVPNKLRIAQRWAALPELGDERCSPLIRGGNAHFDVLRTRVLRLCEQNGWKRIAITSAGPKAGKSTVAAGLALSFGRMKGFRTILWDMDMRHPSIGGLFGQTGTTGIDQVLTGRGTFADQAFRFGDNLAVSCNPAPVAGSTEILLSVQTAAVISEVEAEFAPNLEVFDLPPMQTHDDASAFMKHADCAMLVAESDVTTLDDIDICERELAAQTAVLGVVLNKCRY